MIVDDDTPKDVIEAVTPHVLAKGEDWRDKGVVGREWVEDHGGQVVLVPLVAGRSTTNVVNKILASGEWRVSGFGWRAFGWLAFGWLAFGRLAFDWLASVGWPFGRWPFGVLACGGAGYRADALSGILAAFAIHASMASGREGTPLDMTSQPVSVTSTQSSMRHP